jgi:hypothetical protein
MLTFLSFFMCIIVLYIFPKENLQNASIRNSLLILLFLFCFFVLLSVTFSFRNESGKLRSLLVRRVESHFDFLKMRFEFYNCLEVKNNYAHICSSRNSNILFTYMYVYGIHIGFIPV